MQRSVRRIDGHALHHRRNQALQLPLESSVSNARAF
jgi:hypothetical protein